MGCSFKAAGLKSWAKFVIDSILLFDTFFVLFRSFGGRYTGVDSS